MYLPPPNSAVVAVEVAALEDRRSLSSGRMKAPDRASISSFFMCLMWLVRLIDLDVWKAIRDGRRRDFGLGRMTDAFWCIYQTGLGQPESIMEPSLGSFSRPFKAIVFSSPVRIESTVVVEPRNDECTEGVLSAIRSWVVT